MRLLVFWKKFVIVSLKKINHFAILNHLYLNTLPSFQLYHADQRLKVFVLKPYGLSLIFCMKLDGRNDIKPVK